MKNWNFLNTEEIIWWTRKQNWYLNADTKTNTRFPSMTQRTVVSCIVRNHYIVTFLYIYCNFPFVNLIRLKIVGSMKLWEPNQSCISSNHYWKYSKIYIYMYICIYIVYIYMYIFTTEGLFEVAIESWPDWEFRSEALTEWAIRPWVQLAFRAKSFFLLQTWCHFISTQRSF